MKARFRRLVRWFRAYVVAPLAFLVQPFARLLDKLDVVCGWLKNLAIRIVFRGGETPARKIARPIRHVAVRLADRWGELFFNPDETVAPDPLRPSARVVAAGLAQAFSRGVEASPGGFRLLVCRAPGHAVDIRLDATRSRCFVDVRPAAPDAPAHAEAALPPLAPGAEPMLFRVADDNLRLVLRATPAGVFALARGARFP